MEKEKKNYVVPQLEEFDCRVEKGFALSGLGMEEGKGKRSVEGRERADGYLGGAKWN